MSRTAIQDMRTDHGRLPSAVPKQLLNFKGAPPKLIGSSKQSLAKEVRMLAFRIEVDGEELTVAGVEDWAVLALHVTASRSGPLESGRSHVSVGGLALPGDAPGHHHFRWKERDLAVGSRVVVTLLETTTPTSPVMRFRSDVEAQEDAFTEEEAREMRLQDYLELKREFGAEHG